MLAATDLICKNTWQQVWMSRVLRDDHYKTIPRVTVIRCGTLKNPNCSIAIWVSSICQNLQLFTSNGEISIFSSGTKNSKQTKSIYSWLLDFFDIFFFLLKELHKLNASSYILVGNWEICNDVCPIRNELRESVRSI